MSTTENVSRDLWYENSVTSLLASARLYSQLTTAGVIGVAPRNERTVRALLLLLDASVAVAGAVDDNILEDLQALPVNVQVAIKDKLGEIQGKLNKIAEKTTQPLPKNYNEQH